MVFVVEVFLGCSKRMKFAKGLRYFGFLREIVLGLGRLLGSIYRL